MNIHVCDICYNRDKKLVESKRRWRFKGPSKWEAITIAVCAPHNKETEKLTRKEVRDGAHAIGWANEGFPEGGPKKKVKLLFRDNGMRNREDGDD